MSVRSHSLSAVTMACVETTSSRPYHLIIFGASGFTGQFVVEEVARTVSEGPNGTLKWAVAGRSKQKLETVLEQAAGVLGTSRLLNTLTMAFRSDYHTLVLFILYYIYFLIEKVG